MSLPYSSSTPADDPMKKDECHRAAQAVRNMLEKVRSDTSPDGAGRSSLDDNIIAQVLATHTCVPSFVQRIPTHTAVSQVIPFAKPPAQKGLLQLAEGRLAYVCAGDP